LEGSSEGNLVSSFGQSRESSDQAVESGVSCTAMLAFCHHCSAS